MGIFRSLGVQENEQIEHKMLSSAIEKAQEKIEGNNYGIRKNLLEYDQVNNEQREIIYAERRRVLDGENMKDAINKMITDVISRTVDICVGEAAKERDANELNTLLLPTIPIAPITQEEIEKCSAKELKERIGERAFALYAEKEALFPQPEQMREIERVIIQRVIDRKWIDHLVEYKLRGFEMFDEMTNNIQADTLRLLYHVRVEEKVEREEVAKVTGTNKDESLAKAPKKRATEKIYPNDPCPCGSGKKYKQCHGRKK